MPTLASFPVFKSCISSFVIITSPPMCKFAFIFWIANDTIKKVIFFSK
ncbi:hypothetical protein BTURTLESOX_629 [bacterium endosymbiont of Bathymodiolus sp. 5 South]|nr:hypothetical protein BTURTLESOX_629 [bacterium endosymbiont of Bathymodiolus sp. 5 South]